LKLPKKNLTDGSLALSGYNEIFKPTTNPLIMANGESVVEIALDELHPPEFHPFQVNDDLSMTRLKDNIKRYGVREPGLARPRPDGGYELLCGNRRKRACELAGISTLPVIIRELDDDSAVIAMVDSNLEQREKLLYSEKAWAYRVKMEALNHSGVKGDMLSVEVLVEQTGESKNQIFRLVRLTELIITLLDKVDLKQLAFNPAVELSYLTQVQQIAVVSAMDKYEVKPSLSQSVQLKKLHHSGELSVEMIDNILSEAKKPPQSETKDTNRYRCFFPLNYSTKEIDKIITSLLKNWQAEQKHKDRQWEDAALMAK
jgi:ParB family chromosome partitioning protein